MAAHNPAQPKTIGPFAHLRNEHGQAERPRADERVVGTLGGRTPVATTEPVADYMLRAAGANNMTPRSFQADVMNGTDPSAQDVAIQKSLFTEHKVKIFLYNQQVTDSLTESYINLAHANGIPVVGVYETMPTPGYDYQSWMLAEVHAMDKALTDKTSTEHL